MRARTSSQDGYILVAVLGVMLLLTAFMGAGSVLVRSALNSAKIGDDDVAMLGLTEGGMELTAFQLFVLKLPAPVVDGRRVRLTDGVVAPSIVDEAGKVDLNGSDPKLLQAVFETTGMDAGTASVIVARIVAIRGPGRGKTASPEAPNPETASPEPTGAPSPGYDPGTGTNVSSSAASPATDKNRLRGFLSLDQLRDFPELTPSDLKILSRVLTVYNPDGKVDFLTASEDVLRAIPGLTKPVVEEILARRDGATREVVASLQSAFRDAATFTKATSGPAYTVRIDAISRRGRRKAVEAVVAASKSPNDPYYILDWQE